MSEISVNSILDATGGATTTINGFTPTVSNMAGRNRIINGDMRIDQRNAGAAVTANNAVFGVDRFKFQDSQDTKGTLQQSSVAPVGFVNSLLFTSTSAYAIITTDFFVHTQSIEGLNISDFAWGTANAVPVTVSFWVRSSLTGMFGGAIQNSAQNYNYPFAYTISSANTWEQKTIIIAGPTSGTWLTTNGRGLNLLFGLGVGATFLETSGAWTTSNVFSVTGATSVVGTNGATFYITGVQLEEGSVATPFEHRQYGQELALCQRYYKERSAGVTAVTPSTSGYSGIGNVYTVDVKDMRVQPTAIKATSDSTATAIVKLSRDRWWAVGYNFTSVQYDYFKVTLDAEL